MKLNAFDTTNPQLAIRTYNTILYTASYNEIRALQRAIYQEAFLHTQKGLAKTRCTWLANSWIWQIYRCAHYKLDWNKVTLPYGSLTELNAGMHENTLTSHRGQVRSQGATSFINYSFQFRLFIVDNVKSGFNWRVYPSKSYVLPPFWELHFLPLITASTICKALSISNRN